MKTHDGLTICDFCCGVITKDDGTLIHLLIAGRQWSFDYHNRKSNDCLKQKLDQLRTQFAMQKEAQ